MTAILEQISVWAIPVVICLVAIYALVKKVPMYTSFTTGAKDGFSTAIMIIPYLVAMLCAIGMLRASGAMEAFCNLISPITELIGCPGEVLPMAVMRSFTGGGATGMMTDLVTNYGTQSQIGRIASVALGSTETTFYVVAVYFGSVGVSNTRHSIAAGLLGDLASLIASCVVVNLMWF
ncbi:MAG: nucleoside recognition domain-containing protein [Firmicutes bacterium]|nr:spore maturation protein [Bacillota bacterium]MDD7601769.1 nucleoside recognition domain-containing protein [Bacillota bacterium]MDY5855479.1 nucleoside recognition domain-containing protein [Anaerovoracaceae bacterium]